MCREALLTELLCFAWYVVVVSREISLPQCAPLPAFIVVLLSPKPAQQCCVQVSDQLKHKELQLNLRTVLKEQALHWLHCEPPATPSHSK